MKQIPSGPAAMTIGLGFSLAAMVGCGSVPAVAPAPDQINWPAAYEPAKATFFVTNQIDIAAPPAVVWQILIDASAWENFYKGASDVTVEGSADGKLAPGAVLKWRTMDLDFASVVHEFEPPYRLAWESRRRDIQGYHAWLLIPTPAGTRLVTDESQFGFLARMQRWFLPNKLRLLHDEWLLQIKQRAEAKVNAP
jgi:uncharacterized protein YndB with AHSA1/START domain